jgi:benzoyl-CoA reductase/2-hydroxyglutaryl-CoA dehydratase subunit BcrC/BadD/HgdB
MVVSAGNNNKIDSLVRSVRIVERMSRNRPDVRKSELIYNKMLTDYFTNIRDARSKGNFLALHTVFMPAEILRAMNIVPMHAETTTWMTAIFTQKSSEVLAAASAMGLATEICSAHRGLAGAYKIGALPRPDVVLWSALMCDNTSKSGEVLMDINRCPGFFLDHPFRSEKSETDYLVDELKNLVQFLQAASGHDLDWDLLSRIITEMDKQMELSRAICNLRKHVPSPFPPQRFFELLMVHYLFAGLPEATLYLETLLQEMKDNVNQGRGLYLKERFRLMSLLVPPMHLLGFLSRMPKEYGAVSVVEPLFSLWADGRLDPEKPLESIAQRLFMFPEMCMFGPLDDRVIKSTVDSARQFKVDGAICYAHIGCRQTGGVIKVLKDVLNEADVPVLTLDCDILDPTIASEEEIRGKMEQFFELLEDR